MKEKLVIQRKQENGNQSSLSRASRKASGIMVKWSQQHMLRLLKGAHALETNHVTQRPPEVGTCAPLLFGFGSIASPSTQRHQGCSIENSLH